MRIELDANGAEMANKETRHVTRNLLIVNHIQYNQFLGILNLQLHSFFFDYLRGQWDLSSKIQDVYQ